MAISWSAGAIASQGETPLPDGRETDVQSTADDADLSAEEKARRDTDELCRLLTGAADKHGLPHDFFIRLIWKESRFNAGAVSPVGAQGIAQFMPGTARIRGLKNPFDREEALYASASFLADLEERFGSWGLAAAGYNGVPNRVPPFVEGSAGLPYETIDYVFSITGRSAHHLALKARRAQKAQEGQAADTGTKTTTETVAERGAEVAAPDNWRRRGALEPVAAVAAVDGPHALLPYPPPMRPDFFPARADCPVLIARLGRVKDVRPPSGGGGWTVWGAQVAGHPKRSVAMRQYARIKPRLPQDLVAQGPRVIVRRFAARGRLPIHAVQFAAPNRAAAQALCRRISKSLAPCVVVRNG
ncbi:MAG: lytic transglycosylase domain-containing protein [Pseudomonadota bacterium]